MLKIIFSFEFSRYLIDQQKALLEKKSDSFFN
jgi:hypothetical protein